MSEEDGSSSDGEEDYEEIYEVTYVEDYIDSVSHLDDIARHNSLLLELHCGQMGLLRKIENEVSNLLGNEGDNFDPLKLSNEKREILKNLEDMLLQVSRIGDNGVLTCDEIEKIINERLHILKLDYQNLVEERAKFDSDAPSVSPRRSSGSIKKPSINPTQCPKGARSKQNSSKVDTSDCQKLASSCALSTTGSASPAPSFGSTSSLDSKSVRNSQPTVDVETVDDSRYRSCKFRNPPNYVFNSRSSNSNTPKKSQTNSQKMNDEVDSNEKLSDKNVRVSSKQNTSSQTSSTAQGKSSDAIDASSDLSEDTSSSDSEDLSPEPVYCICEKVSRGKMVQCDNSLCPIEWFHFKCVKLKKIPKGQWSWYCPLCRGKNSTVMKAKSEFFKELEEYNKKKENEVDENED